MPRSTRRVQHGKHRCNSNRWSVNKISFHNDLRIKSICQIIGKTSFVLHLDHRPRPRTSETSMQWETLEEMYTTLFERLDKEFCTEPHDPSTCVIQIVWPYARDAHTTYGKASQISATVLKQLTTYMTYSRFQIPLNRLIFLFFYFYFLLYKLCCATVVSFSPSPRKSFLHNTFEFISSLCFMIYFDTREDHLNFVR